MNDYKPDIWQMQAQVDISGLIEALQSDNADIRRRAAAALRTMGAQDAIQPLKAAYAGEHDADTKVTIASALQTLTDDLPQNALPQQTVPSASARQTTVTRLIEQLKSNTPDDVIDAAQKLGELGDKLAVEPLVLIFNDARMSIQVRHAVAEALLKLESAPVEVALLANLRHKEWHIRRNGAAILGQLEAEWAIHALARALNDPHKQVRRTARAALKRIGTPEARKALARDGSYQNQRKPMQPRTPDGKKKEIKTPPIASPANGLLRFIEGAEEEQKPMNKKGTEPLSNINTDDAPDAHTNPRIPAHYEPTQPISKSMLNELLNEADNADETDDEQ